LTENIRESVPPAVMSPVVNSFSSRFTFGDNSTAIFNFGVVLDPLSESAQKWSSLLLWLLNIPGVSVDLRVHPNVYTEVSLKICTCDPTILIVPGSTQTVLSVQSQIVSGVRPRRVSALYSEVSTNLLMSTDKRPSHTHCSPGCHRNQSILLRQMFHRPGWSARDRRLMISITSDSTQSFQRIVQMGFTRFSVSTTSSSKDTHGTYSRPPLPVGCSFS